MTQAQRLMQRRLYLHDLHSRIGHPGWHQERQDSGLAFAICLVALVAFMGIVVPWAVR
jgi:hypothetical protein